MARFLWICLGSAFGGGMRYLVSLWLLRAPGHSLPFATLFVNVLGSFLLGGLMVVGMNSQVMSTTTRLALTAGVMGGFTTYSTFNYETLQFLDGGAWAQGAAYIATTLLACLAAGSLGAWAGRALIGA